MYNVITETVEPELLPVVDPTPQLITLLTQHATRPARGIRAAAFHRRQRYSVGVVLNAVADVITHGDVSHWSAQSIATLERELSTLSECDKLRIGECVGLEL